MTALEEATIKLIADEVRKGHCILFLGAGVHAPPPEGSPFSYSDAERPALGRAFSESLAQQCTYTEKFPKDSVHNLQRVSLCYELDYSRQELVARIAEAVQRDKRPSPAVAALAELAFPLIITTNYDQLFEDALRRAGKRPHVSWYQKDPIKPTDDLADWSEQDPFVFKLHGDIDAPESIVVTDEDYITFVLRMSDKDQFHPVPETFRYYFSRWPTLFVGYSLLDYNLRLLFKTLRWKTDIARIPPTYAVDPYPDALIMQVWSGTQRYVRFIVQDVWTFVPKLYGELTGKQMA
jgi:hypothetical protein